MARTDWSRVLPQPLVIPKVMTVRTLNDVRELLGHLPADRRARPTWRYVAQQLNAATKGGELAEVIVALRLVFSLEGVECRLGSP